MWIVQHHVKITLRPGFNISDTAIVFHDNFLRKHLATPNIQAFDLFKCQSTGKGLVFPFREQISGIKFQGTTPGRLYPVFDRLVHAILVGWKAFSFIRFPVADDRPTIIFAHLQDIKFIASHRSVFSSPDLSGDRMLVEPLDVSIADAVNSPDRFRKCLKWILFLNLAVIKNPIQFACRSIRTLDVIQLSAVAN